MPPPSPVRAAGAPVRYSHRCMWAIVAQWPGFYRALRHEHRYLLHGLPEAYRRRVVRSVIRTASFLHMLARVLGRPLDRRAALLTGILAALFDHGWEAPATIAGLVRDPDA